jgi:hypothetical protein
MARQVCKHRGIKLPDNTTCGGRCRIFPGCLPPLSSDLLGQIVNRWTIARSEIEATAGANDVLERLHEAILQGLAIKDRHARGS